MSLTTAISGSAVSASGVSAASPVPITPNSVRPTGADLPTGDSQSDGQDFVDRRHAEPEAKPSAERRQFGSSHLDLSNEGRELALAIDAYKVENHRRYLTCDELVIVMKLLGYNR